MQTYCEKEYQDWKSLFTIRQIQSETSESTDVNLRKYF